MKKPLTLLLVLLAAACASPYQPVFAPGEGDYYIAEFATPPGYYGGGRYDWGMGMYPWWLSSYHYYGYPPTTFYYYSPYFYPYRFSVWYPGWQHPHYGFGGWYPPYRRGHSAVYVGDSGTDDGAVYLPIPSAAGPTAPGYVLPVKYSSQKPYRQIPAESVVAPRQSAPRGYSAGTRSPSPHGASANRYSTTRSGSSARSGRLDSRSARPSHVSPRASSPTTHRPPSGEQN